MPWLVRTASFEAYPSLYWFHVIDASLQHQTYIPKNGHTPDLGAMENKVVAFPSANKEVKYGSYAYLPLVPRCIRLLTLLPGSDPDPISIQLNAASLENPGPYKALSYVWGDAIVGRRKIYVGGTMLCVTANLFHALCRFRHASEARTWWIDAVCIDQSSTIERSQQVIMMMEIYTKAEEVVMWLGEDGDPNLGMLFKVAEARHEYARCKRILQRPQGKTPVLLYNEDLELMRSVANIRDRYISQWLPQQGDTHPHYEPPKSDPSLVTVAYRDLETGEAHSGPEYIIFALDFDKARVGMAESEKFPCFVTFLMEAIKPAELDLTDAQSVDLLSGLNHIASRPYWRRAWIVQEAIVPNKATLVCGKHELDFDVFCMVYGFQRAIDLDVKNVCLDDVRVFNIRASLDMILQVTMKPTKNDSENFMSLLEIITRIGCHRARRQSKQMRDLTLGRLMEVFRGQNATDPRDLVFSLAGLLQHFSELPLQLQWAETSVDYSLDVQIVFKNAAKHIVDSYPRHRTDNQPRTDHILSFVKFDPSRVNISLPSWVPDWISNRDGSNVLFAEDDSQIDTLIEYDASVQGDLLVLSGHIVDTVTMSSSIGHDENFYFEVDLCSMIVEKNLGTKYGSHQAQFEAFWRTIVADSPIGMRAIDSDGSASLNHDALRSWVALCSENYRKLQQIWSHGLEFRRILGPRFAHMKEKNKQGDKADPFLQALLEYVPMETIEEILQQEDDPKWSPTEAGVAKQFIITEGGFFGTGLPGVEVGDVVAILAGSGNPWYLRKQGEHYIVIGKGWVHGLMYKDDEYHKRDWSDKIETIRLE
ncbi:heterokaryon incompatibility protein domain-containing protein [Trichoderma barbatum]